MAKIGENGENLALQGGISVEINVHINVQLPQKLSINVPNSYGHGTSKCNEMSLTQQFL